MPRPRGFLPGQRTSQLNPTEELLVRWSRRVKITYLGVYDTVGAVGWDALAIPGIRSRMALHHNMRPTTLIQRCRHALAIDEHRSSFRHTPFVAYISGETAESELQAHRWSDDGTGATPMASLSAAWTKRIEQRWFVGAHSNVGGGYDSNPLAQLPLTWLLEGARNSGLICDPFPKNGAPDRRTRASRLVRGVRQAVLDDGASREAELSRHRSGSRDTSRAQAAATSRPRSCSSTSTSRSIPARSSTGRVRRTSMPPPNLVEYARRKKVARQRPRHHRRENAQASLDGQRVPPLPRAGAVGDTGRRRNSCRRSRVSRLDAGMAARVVARGGGSGIHPRGLGRELSELHDGRTRVRACASRVPRFHLLDARALRRPVRLRRPSARSCRWPSRAGAHPHWRTPGSDPCRSCEYFGIGRHRRRTGRRPRRRVQSSLFGILVTARERGHSGGRRQPAGDRPA